MSDREMRTAQRALLAQGVTIHLVIKDNGYEGHDVWCLVAGPPVEEAQWRAWQDEHSDALAACSRKWNEGGGRELNGLQQAWLNAHGRGDLGWPKKFWASPEGLGHVTRGDAFLAPLFAEVGKTFEDFLVKHKGMTRVSYERTVLE